MPNPVSKKKQKTYYTVDDLAKGTKKKVAFEEQKEEKQSLITVTGYSLKDIDLYLQNYLSGNVFRSAKEKKFFEVMAKHFREEKGRLIIKSKYKTLRFFT